MDVPGQLQQIRLLLAENGLVPVLEQMAKPLMAPIEIDRIPGEQLPHALGERAVARARQKMEVVRHEGPGIHDQIPAPAQGRKPAHEVLPVSVVLEDFGSLVSSPHDVVQGTRGIQPWLSGHAGSPRPFPRISKCF
jgi:hypothetical protein